LFKDLDSSIHSFNWSFYFAAAYTGVLGLLRLVYISEQLLLLMLSIGRNKVQGVLKMMVNCGDVSLTASGDTLFVLFNWFQSNPTERENASSPLETMRVLSKSTQNYIVKILTTDVWNPDIYIEDLPTKMLGSLKRKLVGECYKLSTRVGKAVTVIGLEPEQVMEQMELKEEKVREVRVKVVLFVPNHHRQEQMSCCCFA
jgi:glycogen synthase